MFQYAVDHGRIEFRDVKYFGNGAPDRQSEKQISSKYEDKSSFWKGRMSAATHACRKVASYSLSQKGGRAFSLRMIFPQALSEPADSAFNTRMKPIVLNNFRGYAQKDVPNLVKAIDSGIWDAHSTKERV